MEPTYLCYDIRGIQRYIFAVPRLKYVIGASGLVAEFDRATAPNLAKQSGVEVIACAGGRGTFVSMEPKKLDVLSAALVEAAHQLGLDLRLGRDPSVTRAAAEAVELWPAWIDDLSGEPCAASGMFPVPAGKGKGYENARDIHPAIWKRVEAARDDDLGNSICCDLGSLLEPPLKGRTIQFFRNLDPDDVDNDEDRFDAQRAADAMDGMNSYAIVSMDGNDIGQQLRDAAEAFASKNDAFLGWIRAMSGALTECTRSAFLTAASRTLVHWSRKPPDRIPDRGDIVLPMRPLVLGGDDLLLLIHSGYAIAFVREMIQAFADASQRLHDKSVKSKPSLPLWIATGGRLSISAGIAYVNTKFPLHSGINIAEALLAQAKHRGRGKEGNSRVKTPSFAALDWEQITECAVDTPADRRNREMIFVDVDNGEVQVRLTQRPYLESEIAGLAADMKFLDPGRVPSSIRHGLLPTMRRAKWERARSVLKLAGNHPDLAGKIAHDLDSAPHSTRLIDAAMLVDMGCTLSLGNRP